MNLKVHIAFGFHVNLYHSFRGDSNDEKGFGGDIRVIRKIIKVLDGYNQDGVMVKGTWDFENAYSLEKILPEFAPDIIDDVRERVRRHGDEIILMSYNNGLVSCMDEKEFTASMEWAVSNPFRSGARDIFGACAPVARPQEMMFSPSNVSLYNKIGVQALCLYYSGVPFDSFRTLIPLLPEENAFNPLWFRYKDEKITVIPAISHSDLVDYGCLGALVKRLHKKQAGGEIENDVLVFINMDADALLWYGLEFPFPLSRLPNAAGLYGLIKEVSNLPYVVFDTPYCYLKNHPPLKTITFNQDTADGMFDGYSSWAEKPFNHLIWSRLEKARILAGKSAWLMRGLKAETGRKEVERLLDMAFYDGVCLMSTTHFGLSAPHINREREVKALRMSGRMLSNAGKAWGILREQCLSERRASREDGINPNSTHKVAIPIIVSDNEASAAFISMSLPLKKGVAYDVACFTLYNAGGEMLDGAFLDTAWYDDGSFEEIQIFAFPDGTKPLELSLVISDKCSDRPYNRNVYVSNSLLSGEGIEVTCEGAAITDVRAFGERIGGRDFLRNYIRFQHGVLVSEYEFQAECKELLMPFRGGRLAGYRFRGRIGLPGQLEQGSFLMDLFIVDGIPALMIKMNIKYPYTEEKDLISNEVAVLGHYCDSRWLEVAPVQITPALTGKPDIIKYNYQGALDSYNTDDFRKADERNSTLDSFNNHITAGFTGVSDGGRGMIAAVDRNRLNSMAFCPMRTFKSGNKPGISLNPFGTYYGRQRHHHTYTGGLAQTLMAAVSPYLRSLAPAYNGVHTDFMLALFPFKGKLPDEKTLTQIKAFCNGGVFFTAPNQYTREGHSDYVKMREKESPSSDDQDSESTLSKSVPLGLRLKVIYSVLKSLLFH